MAFLSSADYVYGDTRSKYAAGRRICISHIPNHTKVRDIFEFFGKETIEGISIVNKDPKYVFAFVQFKRPSDHTEALLKNQHKFMGHTIQIRPYTNEPAPNKLRNDHRQAIGANYSRPRSGAPLAIECGRSRTPPHRDRDRSPARRRDRSPMPSRDRVSRSSTGSRSCSQSQHRTRSPVRKRARSRSRERSCSRSPARTLSISDETYTRPKISSSHQQPKPPNIFTSIGSTSYPNDALLAVSTVVPHHWTQSIPARSYAMPPTQNEPPQRSSNGDTLNNINVKNIDEQDLPPDVELILNYVLQQKTARHLSLHQLQKVSQYINHNILKLERPSLAQAPPMVEAAESIQQMTNGDDAESIDESEMTNKVLDKLRLIYGP